MKPAAYPSSAHATSRSPASNAVRVLLIWPGTEGAAGGNFGVPQLVTIASYVHQNANATVEIVDLVCERALGPIDLNKLFSGPNGDGYDIVGFSCYASYDFLKLEAIATVGRAILPNAVFVVGGYHASARPSDFFEEGSPFNVVVVGEGEKPLVKLIEMVAGGDRPKVLVMDSDPIVDLDRELPPSDWSLLDKYRGVIHQVASQAMIYLSRGCPFDCVFCMERAKREVSWRAFSVERAIDEMRRLAAFCDLSGMTVYIADALFGMRPSWRRAFLAALARERLPVLRFWLLIRVDLMDEDDLTLFADANCSPGFGLESGDPKLLGIIRKAGRLDDYLDRMKLIAARARELNVPWGANVIMGHPGETEASLRLSAKYLSELFLDPKGTTGFLSVDPFRLYPGSPIDDERSQWEARYGTRFHRPMWWKDGDQEFLSEWVDPSHELDYRDGSSLTHELLAPTLDRIENNFVFQGASRDYFMRAIRSQAATLSASNRLHFIGRHYAWNQYTGRIRKGTALLRNDREAATLLREARHSSLDRIAKALFPSDEEASLAWRSGPVATALSNVPREQFVPLDQVFASADDKALPLDSTGDSTVSAIHAYARSFLLVGIKAGSRVLDLGGGMGYGAAVLCEVVGSEGCVVTVEVDPNLAEKAAGLLAGKATVIAGDCLSEGDILSAVAAAKGPFDAIVCGFAVPEIPRFWGAALKEGGIVVVPTGGQTKQILMKATWGNGSFNEESHGEVLFVRARRQNEFAAPTPKNTAQEPRIPASVPSSNRRIHLPLV